MIELAAFRNKRVLLLQGPLGPFFHRWAQDLGRVGAEVFKINFNGGDWLFYPGGAINYRGSMADWPARFEMLVDQLNIDVVFLFGDCRPVHEAAREIAHRRGIEIGVFEEGYIRPDYVTLERFGANNHSLIPRDPAFYQNHPAPAVEGPRYVGNTYWHTVLWAVMYYFMAGLLWPLFRHYRHHRPLSWLEALPWLRSAWRKFRCAIREWRVLKLLTGELDNAYFVVPLQVFNDAQVRVHSDFSSVGQFIWMVMESFARSSSPETVLVIKHHPMDRGYCDYTELIGKYAEDLRMAERYRYIHDQHLPSLLQHARGAVVINSTVGLSALHHGIPVKVCGNATYDMPGLTFQGTLDDFWSQAGESRPDPFLLQRFKAYLVRHTQLNGSFYKRLSGVQHACGLNWANRIRGPMAAGSRDKELTSPVSQPKTREVSTAGRLHRRRGHGWEHTAGWRQYGHTPD